MMYDPATCPLCWYDQEEWFAIDEWRNGYPEELHRGIDEMLGDHRTVVRVAARNDHDNHALGADALHAAADAAEFIASWRGTNAGPTRRRVVAALLRLNNATGAEFKPLRVVR